MPITIEIDRPFFNKDAVLLEQGIHTLPDEDAADLPRKKDGSPAGFTVIDGAELLDEDGQRDGNVEEALHAGREAPKAQEQKDKEEQQKKAADFRRRLEAEQGDAPKPAARKARRS